MSDTIGIDISKYTLDAYWLSKRSHTQFANTSAGLKQLIGWMRQSQPPLVIFESTGAYCSDPEIFPHLKLEFCPLT